MNSPAPPGIRNFVRNVLGCTCPDAVFETVHIDPHPQEFAGLAQACSIAVGGRLLVLVAPVENLQSINSQLDTIMAQGRRLRDAQGFNRFRLVVATPDPQALRAALAAQFEALDKRDDRLHLHVVATDRLPPLPLRTG